jgi:hypothetical protein
MTEPATPAPTVTKPPKKERLSLEKGANRSLESFCTGGFFIKLSLAHPASNGQSAKSGYGTKL